MHEKIVICTGAGISAESGLKTFRDSNGLWEGHDVQSVATPEAWNKNPKLVLEFYNQRRAQLKEVQPNYAHFQIAELEKQFDVQIITQNVDDLHERAGSTKVLHLHGELLKARSCADPTLVVPYTGDIRLGQLAEDGSMLRPHIVWFGEEVPLLFDAINAIKHADIVMIIGTSMQVYPAASLVAYAPENCPIIYLDPKPTINHELSLLKNLSVIAKTAVKGIDECISLFSNK